MKIFLTGGTGFIGSYVVKELSDHNHQVNILARNPNKVLKLIELKDVSIINGKLTDFDIIKNNLKDMDACIHIALGWGDEAVTMLKNDTLPSIFLFETAAKLGIQHIIYTSSTALIGKFDSNIDNTTKTTPVDYYGATKASSENFLHAISYQYSLQCNIIRPGYTFGNPIIEGSDIEPDNRFKKIVQNAKNNEKINIIKYDGTQFIWAGNLAKIYRAVLESEFNRKFYFGLGTNFVSWQSVAKEAISQTGSSSKIIEIDKNYSPNPNLFDVYPIKRDFGFEFYSWNRIKEHIEYLINNL